MLLKNNSILNNRYKLLSLLGEGGYGYVYKAKDILTDEFCTIKQYLRIGSDYLYQYKLEAEILKSITHQYLTKVLAYFFYENTFIIVMEYVDGDDLKKVISKKGAMPVIRACKITRQVGLALHYLHTEFSYPILHRDVKPSNIILRATEEVKLIDFGLMKSDRGQFTTTAARSITTGFSPMEQYSQEEQLKTDVRSDIYSLGATLFFLLTGEIPQESLARSWNDYFFANLMERKEIPTSLAQIIAKSMSVVQDERYPDVQSFINAIDEFTFLANSKSDSGSSQSHAQAIYNTEHVNSIVQDTLSWEDIDNLKTNVVDLKKKDFAGQISVRDINPEIQLLKSERLKTGEVFIKLGLPNNVKGIIIRRSYWKYPEDRFDGEDIRPLLGEGFCEIMDRVHPGPVYYSIFCQYKNKRKAIVTREVAKIDL